MSIEGAYFVEGKATEWLATTLIQSLIRKIDGANLSGFPLSYGATITFTLMFIMFEQDM